MDRTPIAISLCTTCRDRLWQLRETLPGHLEHLPPDCEIVLVDYGSSDGLSTWIWSNFRAHIEAGRLRFFEVDGSPRWSSPAAKNLAHRLSNGRFLFNLDADNFVTPREYEMLYAAASADKACFQWSGSMGDGSMGRIGLPRRLFATLGGYDEHLLPMGYQDIDLIERIELHERRSRRLPAPERPAVPNSYAQKLAACGRNQTAGAADYEVMNDLNTQCARARRWLYGPCREPIFRTHAGRWNGQRAILDGIGPLRFLNS